MQSYLFQLHIKSIHIKSVHFSLTFFFAKRGKNGIVHLNKFYIYNKRMTKQEVTNQWV